MFTSKCLLLALTGLLAVKKAKWPFYYPKCTGYSSLMFQGDLENLVEYFFFFFKSSNDIPEQAYFHMHVILVCNIVILFFLIVRPPGYLNACKFLL